MEGLRGGCAGQRLDADRTIFSTWSSVASMLSRSSEEVALELLPKAAAPTASARIARMLYIAWNFSCVLDEALL